MWLKRVRASHTILCSAAPTRAQFFCYIYAPNKEYPSQSAPQRNLSQDHGQPPTVNDCCPWPKEKQKEKQKKKKKKALRPNKNSTVKKMGSPNFHIPGLTLLNNMALNLKPTAEAPLGGLNTFAASNSPSQEALIPAKKVREPKYAMRKEVRAHNAIARPSNQSNLKIPPNHPPRNHAVIEARQPPSKESGGVPEPTPLYLAQSFPPPFTLAQPRRILVIVDLNGTLLYRPNKRNPFNFIERPHARCFLSYCIDTLHVAIWSSARPDNVHKMVAQLLLPEQRAQCVVTWARDKFGLSLADYDTRVQCYKRLTTIWADPQVIASHPGAARGCRWDQTNTVLVDDSVEKGRSEPHNILQIPEFSGTQTEPRDVLPQVHDYLNLLCYQADISRYMRQSPFRLDVNYKLPPPPAY